METKIFSDSRGSGLTMQIYNITGIDIEVCHYHGVSIEGLEQCVKGFSEQTKVSAAYIMAGINNLTLRDEEKNVYRVAYDTPEKIRDDLMDRYISLIKYCKEECEIRDIIVCTLPGMDVGRYNRTGYRDELQWVIDEGVHLLNADIQTHNAANGYATPMIHQYIHPTMGNARRPRNTYSRLIDGLHPAPRTKEKWALALVAGLRLNLHT